MTVLNVVEAMRFLQVLTVANSYGWICARCFNEVDDLK
jgi:hypothetical protein